LVKEHCLQLFVAGQRAHQQSQRVIVDIGIINVSIPSQVKLFQCAFRVSRRDEIISQPASVIGLLLRVSTMSLMVLARAFVRALIVASLMPQQARYSLSSSELGLDRTIEKNLCHPAPVTPSLLPMRSQLLSVD
jgi:hypothetical protein